MTTPLRITLDGTEYPCASWAMVEEGRPVSVEWDKGFWAGNGQPRYDPATPNRYYMGNYIDTSSPPYIRLIPTVTIITLTGATITMSQPVHLIQARQPNSTNVVYVLNGTQRIKVNRDSNAFIELSTTANAIYGRPALFEGSWRLALGEANNGQTLTVGNGAGTDSVASIGRPARHLCNMQLQDSAGIALADNSNEMYTSEDAANWTGPYEVGESSVAIADLIPMQGELMVIKGDGPYKFDQRGNSRPFQGFVGAHPNVGGYVGCNSHGHGTYAFWVHPSGIWRIVGDLMTPVAIEADPNFYAYATADFTLAAQWDSVCGYGRWIYASRNLQVFAGFIKDDGTVIWHGSIMEVAAGGLKVAGIDIDPTTNLPTLWIVGSASLYRIDLRGDGSMRGPLDGNRWDLAGSSATFRLPRWNGGRMDRTKQLRRFWSITEGFGGTDSARLSVKRDGAAAENVSSAITTNTLTEAVPTPGTNDTFREIEAQISSWTADGTGDPRFRALGLDAHTFDVYKAVISLTPNNVRGYSGGIRGLLKKLRHLKNADALAVKEPETNDTFTGYVLGVREKVVGQEGGDGIGYEVEVLLERGTVPA